MHADKRCINYKFIFELYIIIKNIINITKNAVNIIKNIIILDS